MSLVQLWALALFMKIALVPFLPVTPDEAYYLVWARHPALSYFDHPPVVAWLMTLALPLWKTFWGIRLPGLILGHLSFLPWFIVLKKLGFSDRASRYWFLGTLLGPLTGLGSFIITPDIPLSFFWAVSVFVVLQIDQLLSEKKEVGFWWTVLGLVTGLGLLSKYNMVLFWPCCLVWFFIAGRSRYLKLPGLWYSMITAFLVFAPVLIWNFRNGFASFGFQMHHGLSGPSFDFRWPLDYLTSQFGLVNPFFFAAAVAWLFSQRSKLGDRDRFLAAMSLPLLLFFITSFRARVEANWPLSAYPAFLALGVRWIDSPPKFNVARVFRWSFVLASSFFLIIASHTIKPWLPIPQDKDHTRITREWHEDVVAAQEFRPLFARSYQMAAFHSYYRQPSDEVFKLAGIDRRDVYDYLPESTPRGTSYLILHPKDRKTLIEEDFSLELIKPLPSGLVLYKIQPR